MLGMIYLRNYWNDLPEKHLECLIRETLGMFNQEYNVYALNVLLEEILRIYLQRHT